MAVAAVCASLVASTGATPRLRPQSPSGDAPHVVYSTLLGGEAGDFDGAYDVAVDAGGNAYVVGATESSDFPTRNALQSMHGGDSDAFVAKFGPDGELLFSTFLGGSGTDEALAVAVDAEGAIYVVGSTSSTDFPTKNAFQATRSGSFDAFVTKIDAGGGSIVFSSYLGGSATDTARDVAVDADGMVYVAGTAFERNSPTVTFPTVNPIQEGYGGGDMDAFASFLSPDGALVFSTLFDTGVQDGQDGGSDQVTSVLVDSATGDVFVAGNREIGDDVPEVPFIARFRRVGAGRPQAPQLLYQYIQLLLSELDAGSLTVPQEFGVKLAIIYLVRIRGLPSSRSAGGAAPELLALADGLCHPDSPGGGCDEPAAIAAFSTDFGFKRATNLPVLREFYTDAAAADAQGALYLTGYLSSESLMTLDPLQETIAGRDDVVIAALAPGSYHRAFATYFGGDGYDHPSAITVDSQGNVYVVGVTTLSTTFPVTPGAFQTAPKGSNDAFVVKISGIGPFPTEPDFALSFAEPEVTVARGSKIKVPLEIERIADFDGRVTVTSPESVPGIKLPKKPLSTTGTALRLKIKAKRNAEPGSYEFTFTGRDADGRTRSATLRVQVE